MPMDETLAVAAVDLGGRPHAVVDLALHVERVGDLQSELIHDFFEGFRAGRARQRPRESAVRPFEPPSCRGGVQGVRTGAARGVLARQAACAHASQHERAVCDCADRLRRRQPDVGAQSARGGRRRGADTARAVGSRRRRRCHRPGRRQLSADGGARPRMARRHHRRRRARPAAARHLPRPAMALRRQQRGARDARGCR